MWIFFVPHCYILYVYTSPPPNPSFSFFPSFPFFSFIPLSLIFLPFPLFLSLPSAFLSFWFSSLLSSLPFILNFFLLFPAFLFSFCFVLSASLPFFLSSPPHLHFLPPFFFCLSSLHSFIPYPFPLSLFFLYLSRHPSFFFIHRVCFNILLGLYKNL